MLNPAREYEIITAEKISESMHTVHRNSLLEAIYFSNEKNKSKILWSDGT